MVLMLTAVAVANEARAQEVTLDSGPTDIQYSLPSVGCDSCGSDTESCDCGGIPWPRFGMYLKAGPSFLLNDALFPRGTDVGYQIAFGGREPLVPINRQVFVDIGGSYLSAFGRGDPLTISGDAVVATPNPNDQNITRELPEFQTLTLNEISRASLHTALGWNYNFSDVPEISRLLTIRFGGRLSFIHGHFREKPTDALQTILDAAEAAGNSVTLANDPVISKTDTAPGIFAGIELANSRPIGRGATASFLIDGEFASDWLDLRNYADGSLVTATLLLGLSINR
jgi:hypothetical protein